MWEETINANPNQPALMNQSEVEQSIQFFLNPHLLKPHLKINSHEKQFQVIDIIYIQQN